MNAPPSSKGKNGMNGLVLLIGLLMVSIGMAITCMIGYTAYQIIQAPQNVKLISYIFEQGSQDAKDLKLHVSMVDKNSGLNQENTVTLPKEVSLFGLALLALIAFRIVASIAFATIKHGVTIVQNKQ